MKKVACYCSGKASRIIKYFEEYNFQNYPLEFVFYDGMDFNTVKKLKNINCNLKVINYKNVNNFKGKFLSQSISNEILIYLDQFKIDYMFCFGSNILKPNVVNKYKNRIVNFHPSLLPKYPGLNAIDRALKKKENFLGNTAHFVDEGIDTGKIIMQSKLHIKEYENYESVLKLQIPMLNKIWNLIKDDKLDYNFE